MKGFNPDRVEKLLIRSVNWVGDAVMSTPAIGAIRASMPQAEITLLANPIVSELFTPHEWIDRVITFDRTGRHRGLIGRLRLAAELRKQAFDATMILPNSFDSALVPWLAGIPVRLGKNSDGRGFMLTGKYRPQNSISETHEIEYYLGLVQSFGIDTIMNEPRLFVTAAEIERAENRLRNAGVEPGTFLIGINPGAAFGSAKRWYPERFAEAARRLADQWSAGIIIFGGPNETDIAADIEKLLEGNCLNLAGKTTVRELMALIKRCNFFITNDSGPMHIAAAFGVPLVAIFGSTDHVGTAPYSGRAVVVRQAMDCAPCKLRECPTDHQCMTAVSADDVVSAAQKLFNANN